MTETAPRPLPVDDDIDTAGFFEAARRGELVVRACDRCGAVLHVPRAYCRTCGSSSRAKTASRNASCRSAGRRSRCAPMMMLR